MSTFFLEGFDGHNPANVFTSHVDAHRTLLSIEDPANDNWFSGVGDKAGISSVESRLTGGHSLEFTRGAATGGWTETTNVMLGFGFVAKQSVVFGFAVKYSDRPDKAIPVAMFKGSTNVGEQEQACLWLTPDGKIFFAENSYNNVYSVTDTVTFIAPATTPSGVFRFGTWQYIELAINYTGTTPTVTVYLNGEPVLENISDNSLLQISGFKYVSSANIINACTGMFGKPYSVFFDDMYLREGSTPMGPQSVTVLEIGLATRNEWSGGGALTSDVLVNPVSSGLEAGAFNQRNEYSLADVDPSLGAINAIGVSVYGSSSAQFNIMEYGIVGRFSKRCNLQNASELFRVATDNVPLTHSDINGYEVFIQVRDSIV